MPPLPSARIARMRSADPAVQAHIESVARGLADAEGQLASLQAVVRRAAATPGVDVAAQRAQARQFAAMGVIT